MLAGLFEIAWAIALNYSQGFTRGLPTTVVFGAGLLSFYPLGLAAQEIPLGTAYGVWTGIGAVGTAILGMVLFGEPRNALRRACILLIVVGITDLRVVASRQLTTREAPLTPNSGHA